MDKQPLNINLREILKAKVPSSRRRWIPSALVSWLERLVCQEELNGILRRTFPKEGSDFARAALDDLDIRVKVKGLENIPKEGRFIFASNHPLGGLDGITLISVLGGMYGDENLRFPVNDVLMNVRPLCNVFIPINKFGSQGREALQQINETYDSDKQMVFFPAGLVSRKGKKGVIADLKWQKTFVAKAIKSHRDIIPVRFVGENSPRFYRTARWRSRLHIKFNFEQILLPSELCRARGRQFTVIFGKPIKWEELAHRTESHVELAAQIREQVYKMY